MKRLLKFSDYPVLRGIAYSIHIELKCHLGNTFKFV